MIQSDDRETLNTTDPANLLRDLSERVKQLEAENASLQTALHDQVKANKLHLDSHENFRTIIDSEPGCVKLIDKDGIVMSMNPAGLDMVQADSEEQVKGASDFGLVCEEDRESFADLNRRVFAGESAALEYKIKGLRGRHLQLETFAAPLRDSNGMVIAHLGITHDITSRRRDEEELESYRDHLEELVVERTLELERSREAIRKAERLASLGTLAAGLAHELNNPLGSILLGAELALETTEDVDAQKTLRAICADVRRCGRIVTSVLQFSREESSEKWIVELNPIVRLAKDRTAAVSTELDVKIDLELADDLGVINGNETEVERVVINLIENAVRATPRGGRIVVASRREGDRVELRVKDHGSGMTAETLEQAFNPFFTTRLESGGTGLGLSVSHTIVRDHGGRIELESTEGVGTVALVSFPAVSAIV